MFLILGEMTRTNKRINPIHFGNDPADIRSGLIRIRIPNQILALSEFGLSRVLLLLVLL